MYVIYQEVTQTTGKVSEIIFVPSAADMKRGGREIEDGSMVYPVNIPGMESNLMINLENNELYFDYYASETIYTKVSGLQQANAELNSTIGSLLLESANDKATISNLNDTVGNLLLEVAALKGGAE